MLNKLLPIKYLMIERLKDEELILDELQRLGFKLVDESSMNLFLINTSIKKNK